MAIRNLVPLLILLHAASGKQNKGFQPCGQPSGCYCTVPMPHQIQCLEDVKVFPIFENLIKPGVESIVFRGSQIVDLPPFRRDEWDRLKHLSFIDTPNMSCDNIAKLSQPRLTILSHCISQPCSLNETNTEIEIDHRPSHKERIIFLSAIIVFVVLLGAWLGTVCYVLYCYRPTHVYTLPKEQPIERRQGGVEQMEMWV